MIGGHWDISWHRSIGRDTFWTPAHIAIYLCGVLAGISCGYLILASTAGRVPELRGATVRIWGFEGPLGAFIAAWGGIAMLTSAPFDDWWHNAYGLDVKILSPPHVVLITGILAVELGALILVLGRMNRAVGAERTRLERLFLYLAAMLLVVCMILAIEYVSRTYLHMARAYRVAATFAPLVLTGVARASGRRWAATTVAGLYTAFLLGFIWVLPLFPAEPKLGPVYRSVTHFVPPDFPLLFIAPALALDLLRRRAAGWKPWAYATAGGTLFLGVFMAVEWPFASLLMSTAARNRFFGTPFLDYSLPPWSYTARYLFYPAPGGAAFWEEMALALVLAVAGTRLGLAWGSWMRSIRR